MLRSAQAIDRRRGDLAKALEKDPNNPSLLLLARRAQPAVPD
jgi:hypothetical protein